MRNWETTEESGRSVIRANEDGRSAAAVVGRPAVDGQLPHLVSSMGRADLLWPRVDLDLTRKVRSNTGRVNVDQRWARLEAGRGGDSFDPL